MFEYYTFPGNGEIIRSVLNSVAMYSGSTSAAGAAQAAALFGFLVMLGIAVYKIDLKDSFVTLFVIMGIWMGVMVPKTTVLVTETAGYGFTGKQYTVNNVPLGLAFIGYLTTSFGVENTRKMEQLYSLPNDLNYSSTGILFGARLYEQIRSAKITDPILTNDWALFMNNCSFFDINMYRLYSVEDLRNSLDVINTLSKTNVAMFTNVTAGGVWDGSKLKYGTGSITMTCNKAWAALSARTKTLVRQSVVPEMATRIFGQMGVNVGTDKTTALVTLGNNSFQYLLNNSRFDTLRNIEQAAMIELIREAGKINGQRNNNAAAVQQAFAQAQARNQYISAQKSGASMASWNLPILRSIVEAILVGLFPLVVVIALLAGVMALRTIMFYVMAMVWIQLWAPIASIINLIMTIHSKTIMSSQAVWGQITPGSGDQLLLAAVDAQATAGAAMWLIPVIAGALAMAGRGMANSFMGATTSAKQTSEAAGNQAGAGNYNAGNMNYNNANGNKMSLNPVYSQPGMFNSQSVAGNSWIDTANGNSRYQSRNDQYPITPTATISQSDSYSMAADRSVTAGRQQMATAQESYSLGSAQTLAWASQHGSSRSMESGYGLNLDSSEAAKMSRVFEAANEIAKRNGMATSSEVASSLIAKLGVGGENTLGLLPIKAGGEWNGKTTNTDKVNAEINSSAKALQKEGITFDQSTTDKISRSEAFRDAVNSGDTLAGQANTSFNKAESAAYAAQQSFAEAQSHREQAGRTYGNGATVTVDTSRAIRESGMSAQEVYQEPGRAGGAAIAAATGGMTDLKNAAVGTAMAHSSDLTPESKPGNDVAAAHAANVSQIAGGRAAAFGAVSEQARRAGVSSAGIDSKISHAEEQLGTRFSDSRAGATTAIDDGEKRYGQSLDGLIKQTEQMGRSVESGAMRLNSKQNTFDTQKAQAEVRSGEGYAGSGYDNTFAHMVDNPDLRKNLAGERPQSITDHPGNSRSSGSAVFRPKD